MNQTLTQASARKLLALADDELILGHRNSEWTGHAPILEEDIAFANIAQDEIGHAALWLGLRAELTGDDPDQLVFFRAGDDFRNVQMVELPVGDWAFSMLRQFLFDSYEMTLLEALGKSAYRPVAEAAAKMRPEEMYHYRHTHSWVKRLGLGTDESHRRMQRALDDLWPYAQQLFLPMPDEESLVTAGLFPASAVLRERWEAPVRRTLGEAGLEISVDSSTLIVSRAEHTPHLADLLDELQSVARLDPEAEW